MAEDGLVVALRLALYLDMAGSFGVAMFAVHALGRDERGSMIAQRYRVFVGASAAIGIGLSIWGMAALAKTMSGAQSYGELSIHVFEMIITGTPMGLAWCIRLLALMICVLLSVAKLNPTSRFVGLAMSSGVALATLAWAGHGAMSDGVRGYIHLASHVAHLWAAGAWVGALLAFLMLALDKPDEADGSLEMLSRTANGFARAGTLIVVTLAASGLINYWLIAGPSLEPLFTTLHGRLLLGKLALFGGMLGLAAANRFRLGPSLEASLATGHRALAAANLRRSLCAEATLAVLVLASVAWLGTLSPKLP